MKRASLFLLLLTACHAFELAAAEPDASFQESILPLLGTYCLDCHSTETQKGDLDLERFASVSEIKKHPEVWEKVLSQIDDQEMPPKKKRQPSPEQMIQLTSWVQSILNEVALAQSGDPGPVVLRRLSNMEYTYTIRDLTKIESLNPLREFPVDGAAGEGFTNVGAGLVMSPSLLSKYLDAAKEVAAHAVLTSEGLHFSEHTTRRDWTDETLTKIREFYGRYATSGGATPVNLQGIKFDTNAGGRLPLSAYVQPLLQNREVLLSGGETLTHLAKSSGLNEAFLTSLWETLNGSEPSLILDRVRSRFRTALADDASTVVAEIGQWQRALWRFSSVGHIGKRNGPNAWQEPVTPLETSHEMILDLSPPEDGSDVTIYLVTGDAGDGNAQDFVLWKNARIVAKDREDLPLSQIPGIDPALFGKHPQNGAVDSTSICVQAPSLFELHLPAALCKDAKVVATGELHSDSGIDASVQMQLLATKPDDLSGIATIQAESVIANGTWSANNLRTVHGAPILARKGSPQWNRFEAAFDDFRQVFPIALCYTKIVPVDEVVTLTLFYREDTELKRLMLSETESTELDRLWDELLYVSEAALKEVDVFEQLYQFATQDADPSAFEPMRAPIMSAAAAYRARLIDTEPLHLRAALAFAEQAWRRPLTEGETTELNALYQTLRDQGLVHEAAIRMVLTRVLVSPAFLYRGEQAAPGRGQAPVSDWELASRLSYFLWSSAPDAELRQLAASGQLHEPEMLVSQAQRMIQHPNVRRLATEFGAQWLHVRDLETLEEKSERHFPEFLSLRDDMQEEAVRFFIDLFQENRSVLALLDADYSFLNGPLATHYGIPLPKEGADWQRVDGLQAQGRGGILGFAATLSKQSGASRTSPILRGNWVWEVVLGDQLPRPPKDVPVLPEEVPQGLSERQLIERHSSDPACARCHERIDPFGFALEGFDAIGRARLTDAAGAPIDTQVKLPAGTEFSGLGGLRAYLLSTRQDDFVHQFCRKLLGYAVGRGVQLSDQPLLDQMVAELETNEFCVGTAIKFIVLSPQFREVRGRDFLTGN